MRLFLAPALLLFAAPAADQLAVTVEAGTSVTKTFTSALELKLVGISVEIGDDEIDVPEDERPEVTLADEEEIVFVDEYVSVSAGRPTELVRTFETLSDASTQTVEPPDGEETVTETAGESALDGRKVRFTWDADSEEYEMSFADDGDESQDLLDGLDPDGDYRFLLPEDGFAEEVELGDSWELDASAFDRISSPSGDLKIDSDEEDDDGTSEEFSEQFRDNLAGEIGAKLVVIEDGIATIELEGEITTEVANEMDAEDQTITQTYAFTFECEGTLVWDMNRGVCQSLIFGGDVAMTITMENDGEPRFRQEQQFEGTFQSTAEFE